MSKTAITYHIGAKHRQWAKERSWEAGCNFEFSTFGLLIRPANPRYHGTASSKRSPGRVANPVADQQYLTASLGDAGIPN